MYLTAANIPISHAFTTREGGLSTGIYSSLNLGPGRGDERDLVLQNYSLLCDDLGISIHDIVYSRQTHEANIHVASKADRDVLFHPTQRSADGLITNEKNTALLVFVGDCLPILLYDPKKEVIGAVHAGWRGSALNIAGAATSKMIEIYGSSPGDICAAIGPCISKCCFETDADVPNSLTPALGERVSECYTKVGEKFMVDLKHVNKIMLNDAGVHNVTVSNDCTACSPDKYWSHRKMGTARGTQAALIVLKEN